MLGRGLLSCFFLSHPRQSKASCWRAALAGLPSLFILLDGSEETGPHDGGFSCCCCLPSALSREDSPCWAHLLLFQAWLCAGDGPLLLNALVWDLGTALPTCPWFPQLCCVCPGSSARVGTRAHCQSVLGPGLQGPGLEQLVPQMSQPALP